MKWKPLGEQHGGDATSMIVVSQEVIVEVGSVQITSQALRWGDPASSWTSRSIFLHSEPHRQKGESRSVKTQCAVGWASWIDRGSRYLGAD